MIEKISQDIRNELMETTPELTKEQLSRRDKILNSDNPKFIGYGHKISDIEKIVKLINTERDCLFDDALHTFYAAHFDFFITNDDRCKYKAEKTFEKLKVKTEVIKINEIETIKNCL